MSEKQSLVEHPRLIVSGPSVDSEERTSDGKMSSYGAIGLEDDDRDPLIEVESTALRRTHSQQQLRPNAPATVTSRQPYLFTGGLGLTSREGSSLSLHSEEDFRDHNMALRYRLYSRLDPGGQQLLMPSHVIPNEFFSILPFDELKDSSGKQSSLVTIFSIWNTMMGTSLLAMPWALQQAGLVFGLFLMMAMCALSLYTAYRVIESPKGLPEMGVDPHLAEFSDVCRYFFGKKGETTAVVFSVVVLFGGIIVYWVLMSNFLFFTGNVVYESLQPNSSTIPVMENKTFQCDVYCPVDIDKQLGQWSATPNENDLWSGGDLLYNLVNGWETNEWSFDQLWSLQGTVPFYLAIITFPLMNFKSPTFFTKFNVLGTVSVMYILIFTASKLVECGFNMNISDKTSINYAEMFSWRFPALTGTMTLSYFIHNAALTILRNQKQPKNNARDLSIGYILAMCCYIFIGVTFYAAFPVQRSCISDNFLNNFGAGDILSSTARVFLLFQMITVLPLLMFLVRSQLFYSLFGNTWPGLGWVVLLNIGVMFIAIMFACFYPKVGSILRYVGSLSGLIYVFALPCLIYMRKLHMEGRLTKGTRIVHTSIVGLGVLNLIAQFFI